MSDVLRSAARNTGDINVAFDIQLFNCISSSLDNRVVVQTVGRRFFRLYSCLKCIRFIISQPLVAKLG